MTCRKLVGLALVCAALGIAPSMPTAFAQPAKDTPIKVGMVKYFFNDLEPVFIEIGNGMFKDVMKAATGLDGESSSKGDAFEIARLLDSNDIHLGVFHGHEYAWIQKKYPKFVPMTIVVNKYQDVSAFLVVHKNSPAAKVADLRGKTLDLPMMAKQHCIVYLEKNCADNAQPDPKAFFKSVARSKSSIAALDAVAGGKVDAVLVDTITLEFYKSVNLPRFENNLRVLAQSEPFPPPVICYKEGSLAPATLSTIRDGLLKAHTNAGCKELRDLWQIEAFEPVPAGYSDHLAKSIKAYPAPAAQR